MSVITFKTFKKSPDNGQVIGTQGKDLRCENCQERFNPLMVGWLRDRKKSTWWHDCSAPKETVEDVLLRTEPEDSEYRKQKARR